MKKDYPDYRLVPHDGNHLRIDILRGQFTEEEAMRIPGCYFSQETGSWLLPAYMPDRVMKGKNPEGSTGNRARRRKALFMEMDYQRNVVQLKIPGKDRLERWLKEQHGGRWIAGEKAWEVRGGKEFMKEVVLIFGRGEYDIRIAVRGNGKLSDARQKPGSEDSLCPASFYSNLISKGYSRRSIHSYTSHINRFLNRINGTPAAEMGIEQLGEYIVDQVADNGYSAATQNQLINALVLYYDTEHGRKLESGCLPRPFRSRQQIRVLTRKEVERILEVTSNLKHRTILALIYGTGIRLSEAAALRISDVDFDYGMLSVWRPEGDRHRKVPLSPDLLGEIRRYLEQHRPVSYLFEGRKGKPYSGRSIQHILKRSLIRAGIGWNVHVQTLRHSFATHLLENGTGIGQVQRLLGHRSSRTTEVYSGVVRAGQGKIRNPIDQLKWI